MPHSDHYIHVKHKRRPKLFKKKLSAFDAIVMCISVAYPMSALPQAITVFQGHAEGVSLISWLSFLACASLFFVYGLKNRVFPMIISNSLWIVMDSLVIIGILIDRNM
jgi:uncharacterized protein with PQ loop repeat